MCIFRIFKQSLRSDGGKAQFVDLSKKKNVFVDNFWKPLGKVMIEYLFIRHAYKQHRGKVGWNGTDFSKDLQT